MSGTTTDPQPQDPVDPPEPPTPQPGTGEPAAPPPEPESQPEPQRQAEPDWRDKRIATLTRRLREMQEQGRQAPAAQPTNNQQPQPQPQYSQADIDRLANRRAQQMAITQDFNRRCDEAALSGRAQFGEAEFNGRIANLQKLVDNSDQQSVDSYNALLTAALETGEAPKVLHALGADMNEAQRILAMHPTRMAVELTKRAMQASPNVSGAPKPITPVGNRGDHRQLAPDDPDRADHLSTAEWMRRREQQVVERFEASRGGRRQ